MTEAIAGVALVAGLIALYLSNDLARKITDQNSTIIKVHFTSIRALIKEISDKFGERLQKLEESQRKNDEMAREHKKRVGTLETQHQSLTTLGANRARQPQPAAAAVPEKKAPEIKKPKNIFS